MNWFSIIIIFTINKLQYMIISIFILFYQNDLFSLFSLLPRPISSLFSLLPGPISPPLLIKLLLPCLSHHGASHHSYLPKPMLLLLLILPHHLIQVKRRKREWVSCHRLGYISLFKWLISTHIRHILLLLWAYQLL